MPRCPRVISPTGIYHIVVRGINKQRIFEDDKDNFRILRIIRECKEKYSFDVFAFCLMGNHMHLLMRTRDVSIGRIMRVVGTKYVLGFNLRYNGTGLCFRGVLAVSRSQRSVILPKLSDISIRIRFWRGCVSYPESTISAVLVNI